MFFDLEVLGTKSKMVFFPAKCIYCNLFYFSRPVAKGSSSIMFEPLVVNGQYFYAGLQNVIVKKSFLLKFFSFSFDVGAFPASTKKLREL